MLIYLSDSFLGQVTKLADDACFQRSIGNLLLGFREAKHVVMMSRELRKEMERVLQRYQGNLKLIKKHEQDSQALRELVMISIEVMPKRDGAIERQEVDRAVRLLIPYGWFDDSERIQTTLLLVESPRDGLVYQQAALGYLQAKGLKLRLNLMQVPGTGGGCSEHFRQWAGERLLLCVVDSDRRWPGAPLGTTAARVLEAYLPNQPAEVHILPCHELENLLPEGLLREVFAGPLKHEQQQNDLLRKFSVFKNLGVLGALGDFAFLDLKKGLSLHVIHDSAEGSEKRAYLSKVAGQLQEKCLPPPLGFCAVTARRCVGSYECDCIFFESWEILEHVAQYVQRLSDRNELKRIFFSEPSPACQKAWQDIAQRLLSWGCAFGKIAT